MTAGFTNSVTVGSPTSDPNGGNNTATAPSTVAPAADLSLAVDSTPTVNGGETTVVTYTVTNAGPSDAENVVITATFPASVTAPAGWTKIGTTNVYTYFVGTVPAGTSSTVTTTVTVDANVEPGSSLAFDATTGSTTADGTPSNNSGNSDTSIIGLADLALTKSGPVTAIAGEQITYTLIMTNNGPSTAQSVDIKDQLPAGVSLESATVSRSGSGTALCGGTVCQTGDVAVGEVVTVIVVGNVSSDVADGTVITNTAAVFSDTPDPVTTNNSDTQRTTVDTLADLRIVKRSTPAAVTAGQNLTYDIVVTNLGPSAATAVQVIDTLPANFVLAGVSSTQGGCSALPCTLGTIPAGGTATVSVQGTVTTTAAFNLINTASVARAPRP